MRINFMGRSLSSVFVARSWRMRFAPPGNAPGGPIFGGEAGGMANHSGHRERRRRQFREHGIDAFADHEVLELSLIHI